MSTRIPDEAYEPQTHVMVSPMANVLDGPPARIVCQVLTDGGEWVDDPAEATLWLTSSDFSALLFLNPKRRVVIRV